MFQFQDPAHEQDYFRTDRLGLFVCSSLPPAINLGCISVSTHIFTICSATRLHPVSYASAELRAGEGQAQEALGQASRSMRSSSGRYLPYDLASFDTPFSYSLLPLSATASIPWIE